MFELYKDAAGQWRWRLVADKSTTIAESGGYFRRRGDCVKAVERIKRLVAFASIVETIAGDPRVDAPRSPE